MYGLNDYLALRLTEQIMADRRRQAQAHRQLCEAGLARRNGAVRMGCFVLARLGRLLVALGRRLERLERAPTAGGATY